MVIFQLELNDKQNNKGFQFVSISEPAGNQSDWDRWLESTKLIEELYEQLAYKLEDFELDIEDFEITHYEIVC